MLLNIYMYNKGLVSLILNFTIIFYLKYLDQGRVNVIMFSIWGLNVPNHMAANSFIFKYYGFNKKIHEIPQI